MSGLTEKTATAIVAVTDLARARRFYGEVLGLVEREPAQKDIATYRTGDTSLVVYQSREALPGSGNAVAWGGGEDVEAIASHLGERGVTLEQYPELGMEIVDGVHRDGDFRGIWFKDPDGNILHVNSM